MKDRTRLNNLLGKTYMYKQDSILVSDWFEDVDAGLYKVVTTNGVIPVPVNEVKEFIDHLLPTEEESTTAVSTEVVRETEGFLKTLQQTLMENIEMVKKDPAYIKQANSVNSSVNALIGMAKLQLQVGRLKKK